MWVIARTSTQHGFFFNCFFFYNIFVSGGTAGRGAAGHGRHPQRGGAPGPRGGSLRAATLPPLRPPANTSTSDLSSTPAKPRGN